MLAFIYYSFNHLEWYILHAGRIKRVRKHGLHLKNDLAKTNELSLLSALNLAVSSTERFLY